MLPALPPTNKILFPVEPIVVPPPSMLIEAVICRGVNTVIELEIANVMVCTPVVVLDAAMASRKVPGPEFRLLVTVKVSAHNFPLNVNRHKANPINVLFIFTLR
jgi:hypothetical protein